MTAGERVRFWIDADEDAAADVDDRDERPALSTRSSSWQIDKALGAPPPTPPDVAKPPADAKKTPRGVFYKVLKAGKGGAKPTPTDAVKRQLHRLDDRRPHVRLVGDQQRSPRSSACRACMRGWTDGIPLMSVGDKYRFWIPDVLAYKGQPGRPQGMLVFDVELRRGQGRGEARHAAAHRIHERTDGTVAPSPPRGAGVPIRSSRSPAGLINKTFVVRDGATPIAVLQQLHPIFGADVNLDLEAVTTHLAPAGIVTPRLIRTLDGQPWVEHDGASGAR